MEKTISFAQAPSLGEWVYMLSNKEWKVDSYDSQSAQLRKKIGISEYPVRQALTWYVYIKEIDNSGISVSISVPSFADSSYSEYRLLKKVKYFIQNIDGECQTNTSLEVDLLAELRNR